MNLPQLRYLPIRLASIKPEREIPFDLFLRDGEHYVLFRRARQMLTRGMIDKYVDRGIGDLYIDPRHKKELAEFFEECLVTEFVDPLMPLDRKAALLMDASRSIMDSIFEDPTAPKVLRRARTVVDHTIDFVSLGRDAVSSLTQLCSHEYQTYVHCLQVSIYAVAIGNQMRLSREFLACLGEGAVLHDLGKTAVASKVLTKVGELTVGEWVEMKRHPTKGLELLAQNEAIDERTRSAISGHHERLDGSGYPGGLTRDNIALPARIVAVADVYDALTTEFPFRPAHTWEGALKVLQEEAKAGLDADVVRELSVVIGTGRRKSK